MRRPGTPGRGPDKTLSDGPRHEVRDRPDAIGAHAQSVPRPNRQRLVHRNHGGQLPGGNPVEPRRSRFRRIAPEVVVPDHFDTGLPSDCKRGDEDRVPVRVNDPNPLAADETAQAADRAEVESPPSTEIHATDVRSNARAERPVPARRAQERTPPVARQCIDEIHGDPLHATCVKRVRDVKYSHRARDVNGRLHIDPGGRHAAILHSRASSSRSASRSPSRE